MLKLKFKNTQWLTVINHRVFLNFDFSKEQCMLPEKDRMIETCRSVLSVNVKVLEF